MTLLDEKTVLDDEDTRPGYYGGPDNPYEPVKVIDDLGLGPGFYYGSALKYLQRAGKKGNEELKDLKKAEWYMQNGADLGYTLSGDARREMLDIDVSEAWGLTGLLIDVVHLLFEGMFRDAAWTLREYINVRTYDLAHSGTA